MLQQILRDMWVDPMLLQELDEEQKQLLFFKMREEQKRRWKEREIIIEKEEKLKPPKMKQANRKGNQVKFMEGEDKEVWVWVMGEHKNDKSIEEMIDEEEIKKVRLMVEEEMKRISQSNEIITSNYLNIVKDCEIDKTAGKDVDVTKDYAKTVENDQINENNEKDDVFFEKEVSMNETVDNDYDEIFLDTPVNNSKTVSTTENAGAVNKNEAKRFPTTQTELSSQKAWPAKQTSNNITETRNSKFEAYKEQVTSNIYPSKPEKPQQENAKRIVQNLTNQTSKNCSKFSNVHVYPASVRSQQPEKGVSDVKHGNKEIKTTFFESKPKILSSEKKNKTADKTVQNNELSPKSTETPSFENKPFSNLDKSNQLGNFPKVKQTALKKPSIKNFDINKTCESASEKPKVRIADYQGQKIASKVEQAKLDLKSLKEKRMAEEIEKVKMERMKSLQRAGKGSKAILMGWINQEKKAKEVEQEKRNLVNMVREVSKKQKETSTVEMRKAMTKSVLRAERGLKTESQIIELFEGEKVYSTNKTTTQPLKRPKSHCEVMEWFNKFEVPRGVAENSSKFLYSDLDRKESEVLLKKKPPGSFLIRLSHQLFAYALSVKVNKRTRSKSKKVKHFLIESRSIGYQFFGSNQPLFPSLDLFVQHYKENPLSIISPLKLTMECGDTEDVEDDDEKDEDSDVENFYEM